MPVRNEAEHLPGTFAALLRALDGSGFDAEVVLVDDGSTDDSADIARRSLGDRLPLRVVAPVGRGRLAARSSGLEVAQADVVLLLDGRVRLEALRARARRERGERVERPRARRSGR
jgi:glycosyltransferase involved in cell wall biosynthesis